MTKRIKWIGLGTALVCLLVCLALSVGVAYGRYRAQGEWKNIWFQSKGLARVWLWGGMNDEDQTLLPMQTKWESVGEDSYSLTFLVGNGDNQDIVAKASMDVSLQVYASLGIDSPDEIELILTTPTKAGEELRYVGVAEEILQDGAVHKTFGDGWVYRFYREIQSEEGTAFDPNDEFRSTLAGGKFEAAQITLQMNGKAAYTSLLQLRTIAEPTK